MQRFDRCLGEEPDMPGPDVDRIILEIISLERSLTPEGGTRERDGNGQLKVSDFFRTG